MNSILLYMILTLSVATALGISFAIIKYVMPDRIRKNKKMIQFMKVITNLIAFTTLVVILSSIISEKYSSTLSVGNMSFLSVGIVIVAYLVIEKIGIEVKEDSGDVK